MMFSISVNKFLPKSIFFGFEDKKQNKDFIRWQRDKSVRKIQYVSALTGLLYIMMGIKNIFTAPVEIQYLLIPNQIVLLPSYAFFLSYLAYKKVNPQILEYVLLCAPIVAALAHAVIFSRMTMYSTYQAELYIMIFWIFTISGLHFSHALLSAAIVFSIGEIYPYIWYDEDPDGFLSHSAWMIVNMLFGIVGGYLFQEAQKSTFLKELELEASATIDRLTGLYNRVKLDIVLMQELIRAKRYNYKIGILLMDIDFFKDVNDKHGHLTGDEVLIAIAHKIKENIRSSDFVFRWGGEEFIVLCLEIDKSNLLQLAHKVRQSVEQHHFDVLGYKTISIGATMSNEDDTVQSIINRADKALYEVKNNGRNSVKFLEQ